MFSSHKTSAQLALIVAASLLLGCASERFAKHVNRPGFDPSEALLGGPDIPFDRFRVPDDGTPLADEPLDADDLLVVFERGGERRALLVQDLAYHHVAQGTLGGEDYMVTF